MENIRICNGSYLCYFKNYKKSFIAIKYNTNKVMLEYNTFAENAVMCKYLVMFKYTERLHLELITFLKKKKKMI